MAQGKRIARLEQYEKYLSMYCQSELEKQVVRSKTMESFMAWLNEESNKKRPQ